VFIIVASFSTRAGEGCQGRSAAEPRVAVGPLLPGHYVHIPSVQVRRRRTLAAGVALRFGVGSSCACESCGVVVGFFDCFINIAKAYGYVSESDADHFYGIIGVTVLVVS
jgi:hypothetical protein